MKISCCVFDLDGTLLTSENKISDVDKATLKELSLSGVKIIIATGRCELQIKEYLHQLGISDPAITCNGSCISNPETHEILHRRFLDPNDVRHIIDTAVSQNLDYLFYTPDYVYHAYSSKRVKFFLSYNENVREEFRVPIRQAENYPSEEGYKNILKILIHDDTSRIPEFQDSFNKNNTLTIVSSGKNLIDIMPDNTSKGNAVKILAEKLGIPICEVVAFGDSQNDEEMLRAAGFSVAMGNADDSIKKICDYVTSSNDEYGITKAIKHIRNDL